MRNPISARQPLSPSMRFAHQPARRGAGSEVTAGGCTGEGGAVVSTSPTGAAITGVGWGAATVLPTRNGTGSRTVERRRGISGFKGASGAPAIAGAGSGFGASRGGAE